MDKPAPTSLPLRLTIFFLLVALFVGAWLLIDSATGLSTKVNAEVTIQCFLERSAASTCRDRETGCEYVWSSGGGITPRLRADGTPWCGR